MTMETGFLDMTTKFQLGSQWVLQQVPRNDSHAGAFDDAMTHLVEVVHFATLTDFERLSAQIDKRDHENSSRNGPQNLSVCSRDEATVTQIDTEKHRCI